MRLYCGNLSYNTDENGLRDHFAEFGRIKETAIIRNVIGESRGFGFVVFENDADAVRAIEELDGSTLDGRALNVSEAKARKYT